MTNNLFALCFESDGSNTEENFFTYLNKFAADYFGWNRVIFSSFNIKERKYDKNNLEKYLNTKIRKTTDVSRIIIFYDRDLPNDSLHLKVMKSKKID
jgi:hypothetical protein